MRSNSSAVYQQNKDRLAKTGILMLAGCPILAKLGWGLFFDFLTPLQQLIQGKLPAKSPTIECWNQVFRLTIGALEP
jgi:hypothetical protein